MINEVIETPYQLDTDIISETNFLNERVNDSKTKHFKHRVKVTALDGVWEAANPALRALSNSLVLSVPENPKRSGEVADFIDREELFSLPSFKYTPELKKDEVYRNFVSTFKITLKDKKAELDIEEENDLIAYRLLQYLGGVNKIGGKIRVPIASFDRERLNVGMHKVLVEDVETLEKNKGELIRLSVQALTIFSALTPSEINDKLILFGVENPDELSASTSYTRLHELLTRDPQRFLDYHKGMLSADTVLVRRSISAGLIERRDDGYFINYDAKEVFLGMNEREVILILQDKKKNGMKMSIINSLDKSKQDIV